MKEAAGEANMTVLVIVLIAIVAAIATPLITNLMEGIESKACCTDAGGEWRGGRCQNVAGSPIRVDQAAFNNCINGN